MLSSDRPVSSFPRNQRRRSNHSSNVSRTDEGAQDGEVPAVRGRCDSGVATSSLLLSTESEGSLEPFEQRLPNERRCTRWRSPCRSGTLRFKSRNVLIPPYVGMRDVARKRGRRIIRITPFHGIRGVARTIRATSPERTKVHTMAKSLPFGDVAISMS